MKLLKIISVIFLIYFIRRFFQMYKVMAEIQKRQQAERVQPSKNYPSDKNGDVIEAEFNVVKDRTSKSS
jgi:uncharacterized membrane protein